jgi:parvulin-like peptidyl-prolyl isomerase
LVVGLIFNICLIAVGLLATAQQHDAGKSLPDDAVAAAVADEPIFVRDVKQLQEKAAAGKRLSADAVPLFQAQILEEIVNRRLVLASAARTGEAASPKEIDQALADLQLQLTAQHKTLDSFLKEQSVSEKELRRQLAWNVLWEKLLKKYANPEGLQRQFEAHRRDFDGTEISVSHILLTPSSGQKEKGKEESAAELVARAESLRKEILAGTISFADAAKKYSSGRSKDDAGKVGLISRHGPMPSAFTRAAFALNPREISPPVATIFGVHLIRCDEIRPGKKRLAGVESEVRDALARELLDTLAKAERPTTRVKYADHFPHLDPASHTLIKP